jgi:membrane protein implicated in regulation of membrane protease activity
VLRRYLLFQLPEVLLGGILLAVAVDLGWLSPGLGWLLFAVWVLKEAALFPLVRRAYEPSDVAASDALVGAIGRVTTSFEAGRGEGSREADPRLGMGRVRLGPELWNARLASHSEPVEVGGEVCVEAVEGLTLVVARTRPRTECDRDRAYGERP